MGDVCRRLGALGMLKRETSKYMKFGRIKNTPHQPQQRGNSVQLEPRVSPRLHASAGDTFL